MEKLQTQDQNSRFPQSQKRGLPKRETRQKSLYCSYRFCEQIFWNFQFKRYIIDLAKIPLSLREKC